MSRKCVGREGRAGYDIVARGMAVKFHSCRRYTGKPTEARGIAVNFHS
jgi:hypothetical protein